MMKKHKSIIISLIICAIFIFTYISINQNDESKDLKNFLNPSEEIKYVIYKESPEDLGTAHGNEFKDLIKQNIRDFWIKLEKKGISREEVIEFVKSQEGNLPANILTEIFSMSEASGCPYYALLAFNIFSVPLSESESREGCTSWIATGKATSSGDTIMHKNRDMTIDPQVIVRIEREGKNEYIATISAGQTLSAPSGINEHGLVVFNNAVFMNPINYNPLGIDATILDRMILEECESVDDVPDYLDSIDLQIQGGAIFFVGDKDKGAVIEVSGWQRDITIIEDELDYRANHFIKLSKGLTYENPERSTTSIRRYNAAKDFLEPKEGSLNIYDCFELSRHHYYSSDTGINEFNSGDGSICNYHTLSGSTFQIDSDYPEELSVFWTCSGPPDSAIYIPIHLGSSKIHKKIYRCEDAWDLTNEISDNNLGPRHGLTPRFLEIEKQIILERDIVRNYAYFFLENNQKAEARENLTAFDLNKGDEVFEEIKDIADDFFWIDGFYQNNAIKTLRNLDLNDGNISLSSGAKNGVIKSIEIETIDDGWKEAEFYASNTIPIGTNITYRILDASNNKVLYSVISDGPDVEIDMSDIDETSIVLSAEFNTNDTSNSPVLEEWGIIGLKAVPIEKSWFGTYEITLMVMTVGFVGIVSVIIIRKRQYIKKSERLKEKKSTEALRTETEFASSRSRILAWLIDIVIVCALIFVVYLICLIPIFFNPLSLRIGFYPTIAIGISTLFLTGFFYFWLLESYNKGQTIGKRLLKIKTVDVTSLKETTKGKYAINSIAAGNILIIFDLLIGLVKNVGKPEKKFLISQELAKTVIIKARSSK